MRALRTCWILPSITWMISVALAAVSVKIVRTSDLRTIENLESRNIDVSLSNDRTIGAYMASLSVGTPAQQVDLMLDTGSSDIWLLSQNATSCSRGSCITPWNVSKSTSSELVESDTFNIDYSDGTTCSGEYITDTVSISGTTLAQKVRFGLANTTSVSTGVMGIGYTANQATNQKYPSLVEVMADQGLINSKAYSLYLDSLSSSTGTVLFGGVDTAKYTPPLVSLPVATTGGTYSEFKIGLTGLKLSSSGKSIPITSPDYSTPVILDSGTTLTFLPSNETSTLYHWLGAVDDTQGSGKVYVDCNILTAYPNMTMDFSFSPSIMIRVPMRELIFHTDTTKQPQLNFTQVCAFGIHPAPTLGRNLVGDTFLRSAYVVYDLENNQIALAQTKFNVSATNVVDFDVGSTQIPGASVAPSSEAERSAGSGGSDGKGLGRGAGAWAMFGFLVACLVLA